MHWFVRLPGNCSYKKLVFSPMLPKESYSIPDVKPGMDSRDLDGNNIVSHFLTQTKKMKTAAAAKLHIPGADCIDITWNLADTDEKKERELPIHPSFRICPCFLLSAPCLKQHFTLKT